MRGGAGQQGCAFVDLVERVGADHQAVIGAVDHGLGEGEQRFTGAIDRQDVAIGVQPAGRHAKAPLAPLADGLAQGRQADGAGVHRQLVEVVGHGLGDERRRFVLRLTDRQGDGAFVRRRRNAAQQGAELFERVGLKLGQGMVHRRKVSSIV
ncbi:hypothetical protein D9M71_363980 [compost metagenome]